MIQLLHLLIVAVYIVLPAATFLRGLFLSIRKGRRLHLRRFWLTCFGGLLSSIAVCGISALGMHGRLVTTQLLLTAYFATSLLLILKGVDRTLSLLVWRVLRLRARPGTPWSFGVRASVAMVFRAVILFGVGIPYVLATVLTYRPHVASSQNPQTLYHWAYEPVTFRAGDGTRLAGWWIPTSTGASTGVSTRTVVLCHGLSASKATQLPLASHLVPGGYNVLAFDFRGHGESGGQLTSFGDLERRDVLGAVRWLRANHPDACEKVVGLGASTGAAALIAAAADPGPEGQNIDAVAVYDTFDRFDAVVKDIGKEYFPTPMNWLVQHIGMPLAGIQVGTDLRVFAPAEAVKQLWPRPILVIHGMYDDIVRIDRGQALFDAALQPKYEYWIEQSDYTETLKSDTAARLVKRYFDGAARIL